MKAESVLSESKKGLAAWLLTLSQLQERAASHLRRVLLELTLALSFQLDKGTENAHL